MRDKNKVCLSACFSLLGRKRKAFEREERCLQVLRVSQGPGIHFPDVPTQP